MILKFYKKRLITVLVLCLLIIFFLLKNNLFSIKNINFYKPNIVIKYKEQCYAYPNKLINNISENNFTFSQIENDLKLNLVKGGIFYSQKGK